MSKLFILLLAVVHSTASMGEAWPLRPVHLVVGAPAGSGMDVAVRILAEKLQEKLGQPFVIENRVGADGVVAAQRVANAAPDGYTLLPSTPSQLSVNPVLKANLPYDPIASFVPIGMFARVPLVLVVNAGVPANDIAGLIAYAKTNPGKLSYGSGSSIFMFASEMFRTLAGIDMRHIPYGGVPPVVQAILAGDVDLGIVNITPSLPHIRSGRLKALAIMGAIREPLLPEVPTIAESGIEGYEVGVWLGMFAPAGTPPAIVAQLNAAILSSLGAPDVKQKLIASGNLPAGSTPRALGETVERELEIFGRLAKKSGLPSQ